MSPLRTGGELKLSAGTLYRSIQRMLEQGLIVETRDRPAPEDDDERRRYYRITPLRHRGRESGSAAADAARADGARQGFAPAERPECMRAYNLLLRLYPASFRNEYGEEMRAVFARRRARRSGPLGAMRALARDDRRSARQRRRSSTSTSSRRTCATPARMLRRAPGFAITAVLIVALGIGATTAAFSVTDFVLIRPLPFPEPDRLVKVWERTPGLLAHGAVAGELSRLEGGEHGRSSAIGIYHATTANMLGAGEPLRVDGAAVSADLFPTLGVAAAHRPDVHRRRRSRRRRRDGRSSATGSGRREFGGDPGVLGQQADARRRGRTPSSA